MSTIVAVAKDDSITMAWDSQDNARGTTHLNKLGPPKVTLFGESLIGVAGYTVYRNILDHYWAHAREKPPSLTCEREVFEYFLRFWKSLEEEYHLVNNHQTTTTHHHSPILTPSS